jgi:hypothetical protein
MQGKVYRYTGAPDDPLAVWNGLGLTRRDATGSAGARRRCYLPNPLDRRACPTSRGSG